MDFLLKNSLLANYSIYISEVVLEELKQKLQERIAEFNKKIAETRKSIKNVITSELSNITIDPDLELKAFNKFYDELVDSGRVSIIYTPNDIFDEIIKRAIKKIKPFEKGKQEFRDAVIWFTCVKHANEKSIERGLLLTNNTKDFAASTNKERGEIFDIHADLASDSLSIKGIYTSAKSFMQKEAINIIKLDINKPDWVDEKLLSRSYLRDVMRDRYDRLVLNSIEEYLNGFSKRFVKDPNLDDILNVKLIMNHVESIDFLDSDVSTVLSFVLQGGVIFDVVRSTANEEDYDGMITFEHEWIRDNKRTYLCEVAMSLTKRNRIVRTDVKTISIY